jgi:hypothetical protein
MHPFETPADQPMFDSSIAQARITSLRERHQPVLRTRDLREAAVFHIGI